MLNRAMSDHHALLRATRDRYQLRASFSLLTARRTLLRWRALAGDTLTDRGRALLDALDAREQAARDRMNGGSR